MTQEKVKKKPDELSAAEKGRKEGKKEKGTPGLDKRAKEKKGATPSFPQASRRASSAEMN